MEANGSWSAPLYSFPQVRLGGYELNGGTYEVHEVLQACVHEGYNAVENSNDVALLLLSTPSKLAPIKLAPSEPARGCRWRMGAEAAAAAVWYARTTSLCVAFRPPPTALPRPY